MLKLRYLFENYELANLYGYTRILYSTSDTFDKEPDWLIELRKKLGNMLREIENGLDI